MDKDGALFQIEKARNDLCDIVTAVHIPANVPDVLNGAIGALQRARALWMDCSSAQLEDVHAILKAVADPEHLPADDIGYHCPYCNDEDWPVNLATGEEYKHDPDCVVLKARKLIEVPE